MVIKKAFNKIPHDKHWESLGVPHHSQQAIKAMYTLISLISHLMATKVHVMLKRFVVLTWMCDIREFSAMCDITKQC